MSDRIDLLLRDFDAAKDRYAECAKATADLIERLLRGHIHVHRIESRPKTVESLREKFLLKRDHYDELGDVTDLAGVRIICFFAEDVDRVARVIEREFIVDSEHTVDKRSIIDADRFGYVSMHQIVRWTPARSSLKEHQHLAGLRIEIQTKSLLQHAWAEIEHGLGYKHVPPSRTIRRRFSRVAGLLELADLEFDEIRKALLPPPEEIPLDQSSLAAFIDTEPLVDKTDREIANQLGMKLRDTADDLGTLLDRLHLAEIKTLDGIKRLLESKPRAAAIRIATEIFERIGVRDTAGSFGKGISLFYGAYVVAADRFTDEQLAEFKNKAGIELTVEDLRAAHAAATSA